MENKPVSNIVNAKLFPRFLAAILDFVFTAFIAAGLFALSSVITPHISSIKQYKDEYNSLLVDSGLYSYSSNKDSLDVITHDNVEDYQEQFYTFYHEFYSTKIKDSKARNAYWFNVHIYGLEDVKNIYKDEHLSPDSYFIKYGRELFTYQLDSEENPLLDELALPIAYHNDPSNKDHISESEKTKLLSYFYKSDSDRKDLDKGDVSSLSIMYFATVDLASLSQVQNAYSDYVLFSQTLPLAISIFVSALAFYFIIPLIMKNGETIGKKITGICLVNKLGYQYRRSQQIMRMGPTLIYYVLIVLYLGFSLLGISVFALTIFASYLCAIFSKNHLAFHDYFAGTIVVDKKRSTWFKNAVVEADVQNEVNKVTSLIDEDYAEKDK